MKLFTKTVRLPIRKKPVRIAFSLAKYPNGNTAIHVYRPILFGYRYWDTITVNTAVVYPANCACIDTNQHGHELVFSLKKQNLATQIGMCNVSNFCKCPVFQFDLEKFQQYCISNNALIHA